MINVATGNKKKINKTTNNFVDTTALYNNPQFTDGVAGVNNIKGRVKSKIALPDKFTVEKVSKLKNEQVEYLKNEKPLMVNDKNAIQIEKKLLKSFKVDPSTADKLDHEIYKYENQVSAQHLEAKSLWDDVVNRTQQYIKLFGAMASNSIFQSMAGLVARTIAPPPTENQVLIIKDRIKRLDPTLITDVYAISQIVQSPELLAYLKSLYEHVKNNVATNKDLQYIINIIKPVIDYISINSDTFSMSGSPWLVEAYNKIKGTTFNTPIFTPGTASPVPITTAPTTFNFQSDSTASPTERHTEAPTQTQTAEPITQPEPIPQIEPMQPRAPLVGNMPVIYEAYTDAFSTREKLVMFYNNLLGVGMSRSFMQIKQFISQAPGVYADINQTPTSILTNNLMGALHYIGAMPQWAIDVLTERANEINNDPSFFFQPVKTSQEQSSGATLDYSELKKEIYKALENRGNIILFFMDTIYKPDYLKTYPTFKNNIIKETKEIDSKQTGGEEAQAEKIETKVFFDIIYNSLILLNESSLSEFISTIGNEMNILMNDPKFSLAPGETPYDIKSQRLTPQPRTATDATRPQSTPQLMESNKNIILSKNEPQPILTAARIGAAPVSENIENMIKLSLMVPKKDKKYIKEGEETTFIMEYLFSLYTMLFNLGIGGLTKLFETLPIIKKPKESAEYIGAKFPPLVIGGGITTAIKTAYNLIKNIITKKDQTKFIFQFINNIKSIEDVKTMFGAIQSNTIYFDVLADQILKNIKDKQELEMTFGKDKLREKIIQTLMKSFININESNRLDKDFYEQTLTNVLVSLQELVNY